MSKEQEAEKIEGAVQALCQSLLLDVKTWGLSGEQHDAVYERSFACFRQANYLEALKGFVVLLQSDFSEAKYHKACAACLLMQKRYEQASLLYGAAYMLNCDDVGSLYHLGICFMAQSMHEEAQEIFREVVSHKESSRDALLLERATCFMEVCGSEARSQ